MAHHAWLDSLSEDWVSQPRSDTSQLEPTVPSSSPASPSFKHVRDRASRIPRLNHKNAASRRTQHQSLIGSPSVLSERSPNDINIKLAPVTPSKLSQETKLAPRGRHLSRSVSDTSTFTSTGSVIQDSIIRHKSQSSSPSKSRENEPEWKRRLIHGELNYGEAKDLFSSAGVGLESIFRPPQVSETLSGDTVGDIMNDTTLPSSPPPYRGARRNIEDDSDFDPDTFDSSVQHNLSLPRPVSFRPTRSDDTTDADATSHTTGEDSFVPKETHADTTTEGHNLSFRVKELMDEARKSSGQSVIRNEDFSPIFIARHSSESGRVSFAPMEIPATQLRKTLETLRRNQMMLDSDPQDDTQPRENLGSGVGEFEDTDEYAKKGGFLNLQRGGRSKEGSFRRRPLSPPVNIDSSEMLQESSLQASTPKQFPTVRNGSFGLAGGRPTSMSPPSPDLPCPPHPSPEKRPQAALSTNGSPLKLFGPYDTFTNQTLLRRISQFEDQPTNSLSGPEEDSVMTPEQVPHGEATDSSTRKRSAKLSYGHDEIFGAVNEFGAGKLDNYEFDGDISLGSSVASHMEEKENVTPDQSQASLDNGSKFDIHEDVSYEGDPPAMRGNRYGINPSASSGRIRVSKSSDQLRARTPLGTNEFNDLLPPLQRRAGSEGKRPRTSPSKDPTPKRRRTLHRSDIAFGLENWRVAIETVQSSHQTMQSIISRNHPNSADGPYRRSASQPRSSARSQMSSRSRDRAPLAELDFDAAPALATAPASGRDIENPSVTGSRKVSMKTQDFYEAAEEVMAMIRNKARPMTGLASVEESEAESSLKPTPDGYGSIEDSFQESTQEPFSRPPSRDGRPVSRLPARQVDPELVDRLKKYEEHSEIDDILAQSLRSMRPFDGGKERSNDMDDLNESNSFPGQSGYTSQEEGVIISDLPNVRISRNPDHAEHGENEEEIPSLKSQSSGISSFPSVRTGSSRGSDSKRLIAPDVVAQLIGKQVGNMVFDDENKMWKKVKTSKAFRNVLPSEDSEEDPFASIPDLTVDITTERNHLNMGVGHSESNLEQSATGEDSVSSYASQAGGSRDGFSMSDRNVHVYDQGHRETAVEDDEEIEHEISLHEDRIHKATPPRKNLTITFSSPVASFIQDAAPNTSDLDSSESGPSQEHSFDRSLGNIAADSIRRGRHGKTGMTAKPSSRSRSRGLPKGVSTERHDFVPRPVSRIDEGDETACDDQQARSNEQGQISILVESDAVAQGLDPTRHTDLSVVMATPERVRPRSMFTTPIIGRYVGRLSLSPMSEFTVHQIDKSCALEVSYVVGDQYLVTGDGSKKVMSKAVRCLVEKITETEPYEPDWESIPKLDLSNKRLDTLHMLDEFCTGLVTLDASHNTVSHLDGVPPSVRNLRITHNLLSELTAWRQLMNLQYVDVSNNQLTGLSAFKDLVHLRTLRADNNQITSLDGIKFHDTLQVLRVRGNLIKHVDLDGTKMQRLTELDLENNHIVTFENSEQLTSLDTLNLQRNCLKTFAPSEGQVLSSIRYLKLSNNELETMDLSVLPSLRLLHVDRNYIKSITGFSKCPRLDSLSLREQNGNNVLDTAFLDSACEVRKLFLSGNRLSGFSPRMDFLNLQYLELANCGLRSLAPDIGQLMPNLRFLNINFNAIDDLLPLRYIPRLKKLLAAGNRLSEAGKVANALAEFPHLSRLDLRNNGATLGFYVPAQTLVSAAGEQKEPQEFDPFVLPDMDVELHNKFASRLDMDTRMRKRIYDMVILTDCTQLKFLDGLPVDRDMILRRDDVWEALVQSGIIEDEAERYTEGSEQ
ncbi:hypothetical protein GGS20DRAFT_475892 [Poronia punctata]|nr:hypothetical protein GGS20DRAFT_475892 [Poronia punctata]